MTEVFFYGLFMDQDVLLSRGLHPTNPRRGFVDGLGLRIGQRATLLHVRDERAHGVVMELSAEEARALYSEQSVADYVPEQVTVALDDGSRITATCYCLPEHLLSGSNQAYAKALAQVAAKCGLPAPYVEQIRSIGGG